MLCSYGYALVNNNCLNGSIPNCDRFNDSTNDTV